jgi:hypothetical protein
VGDFVLARSEFDPDGPLELKRVEEKFVRTSVVMELVVRGRSIKTTVEHPFYVPAQNDFVPAGQIQAGDHLISHDGELVQVDALHNTDEVTTVYNLRVADHHTYFVGGTIWGWDVWVHNAQYAPRDFVRSDLPPLNGSIFEAFDGVRLRNFKAGDKVYRSPAAGRNGGLEPEDSPGPWFSTRRTSTKAGTESQSNVVKWGNPLEQIRAYEFTQDVTVYYGRVAGGKGYQLLLPRDVIPGHVLKFIPPPTLLK